MLLANPPTRRGAAKVWSSEKDDLLGVTKPYFGVSAARLGSGPGTPDRSICSICSTVERRATLLDEETGEELDVLVKILEKDNMQDRACLNNEYSLTTTFLKDCNVVRKAIKNSTSFSEESDQSEDGTGIFHKLYLEWVDGITLQQWISAKKYAQVKPSGRAVGISMRSKPALPRFLNLLVTVQLLREIAFAVAKLHAAGVVHNDLIPENIIIREDTGDSENPVTLINLGFAATICSAEVDDCGETVNDDLYALGLIFSDVLRAWSDSYAPPPTPRSSHCKKVPCDRDRASNAQLRQLSLFGTIAPLPEDVPHSLCRLVQKLMYDAEASSVLHCSAKEAGEYLAEMLDHPDEYLNDPDTMEMLSGESKVDCDSICIPGSSEPTEESILTITQRLLTDFPRKDINHRLKVHKNAINGSDAVSALMEIYKIGRREDAVKAGNILLSRSIIHSLGQHKTFDDSKSRLYRLQPLQEPKILNTFRMCTENSSYHAHSLLARLSTLMTKILVWATDQHGVIDYGCVTKIHLYYIYQDESCRLQTVDMSSMSEPDRLAFAINLFNLMVYDAYVRVGVPSNEKERISFMRNVSYNVGGHIMSLSDLKHGVMRGNKPPTDSPKETTTRSATQAFSKSDPRLELALSEENVDPRFHFAINRLQGGVSPMAESPTTAWSAQVEHQYVGTKIKEDLQRAAIMFCEKESNVHIDVSKRVLHLSSLFHTSTSDFVSSHSKLPLVIINYLHGEKKEALREMLIGTNGKNRSKKVKCLTMAEDSCGTGTFTSKRYDGKFY